MAAPRKHYDELYKLFASVRTKEQARRLLTDILTPQELDSVAERWQLVQLLWQKQPQRDISKKLHISISKITRGSRVLQYGAGGFQAFLPKAQSRPKTAKQKKK